MTIFVLLLSIIIPHGVATVPVNSYQTRDACQKAAKKLLVDQLLARRIKQIGTLSCVKVKITGAVGRKS